MGGPRIDFNWGLKVRTLVAFPQHLRQLWRQWNSRFAYNKLKARRSRNKTRNTKGQKTASPHLHSISKRPPADVVIVSTAANVKRPSQRKTARRFDARLGVITASPSGTATTVLSKSNFARHHVICLREVSHGTRWVNALTDTPSTGSERRSRLATACNVSRRRQSARDALGRGRRGVRLGIARLFQCHRVDGKGPR
jgi:hypothetical protein